MALTFRFATQSDFALCASFADDGFEDRPRLRSLLPRVWGGWKQSGALMMAVLEDDDLPPPGLAAYAATVFLARDFVDQVRRELIPQLAIRVVERHLDNRSPVLGLDAIRSANFANALNLYIIHYTETFPDTYSDSAKRETRNKMMQGLLQTHSGYGLYQIIHEFCGQDVLPYSLASGMRLRTDYLDHFTNNNIPIPRPAKRPFLVGLTREEADQNWGTALSLLFAPPRPEFKFDNLLQDVLWIALFEQDDDEWIARRLGITVHAVKWRWGKIAEKVEKARPNFFETSPANSKDPTQRAAGQPKRGPEKRRRLLRYLRQHVEELHPFDPDAVD